LSLVSFVCFNYARAAFTTVGFCKTCSATGFTVYEFEEFSDCNETGDLIDDLTFWLLSKCLANFFELYSVFSFVSVITVFFSL